jgi:hypothetical protein
MPRYRSICSPAGAPDSGWWRTARVYFLAFLNPAVRGQPEPFLTARLATRLASFRPDADFAREMATLRRSGRSACLAARRAGRAAWPPGALVEGCQSAVVPTSCERCGAVHGPWGVHARDGASFYEIWIAEDGSIESVMTVSPGADLTEAEARRRFARHLDRFIAEESAPELSAPTVVLRLGLGPDGETGPGYGPLNAPQHLHRPLRELIDLARSDLQPKP